MAGLFHQPGTCCGCGAPSHGTCPGSPDPGYCCCPAVGTYVPDPLPDTLYFTVCGVTVPLTGGCGWSGAGSLPATVASGVTRGTPPTGCYWSGSATVTGTTTVQFVASCPTSSTTLTMSATVFVVVNLPFTTAAYWPDPPLSGCIGESNCSIGSWTMTGTIAADGTVSMTGTFPSALNLSSCTLLSGTLALPCGGAPCTLTN
jgi:hypothetical protein